MLQHPHHAKVNAKEWSLSLIFFFHNKFCLRSVLIYLLQVTPEFCKQWARVGDIIRKARKEYKEDVGNCSFPGPGCSPYKMGDADLNGFFNVLQKLSLDRQQLKQPRRLIPIRLNHLIRMKSQASPFPV